MSTFGFSKNLGPNNFHSNEPNAVFGGRDARTPWWNVGGVIANEGRNLLPDALYQTQNVSKMKLLEEQENADAQPSAQ